MTNRARAVCAISILVFFAAASVLNGVCIGNNAPPAGTEDTSCLVSMDVCGVCAAGVYVHAFDSTSGTSALQEMYFPLTSLVSPEPCLAVASAEPGETGKPPEA